jgi:hypothetical protein
MAIIETTPPAIHTAYNPIIAKINSGIERTDKSTVEILQSDTTTVLATLEREYFNNIATFDLNPIVKTLFNNVTTVINDVSGVATSLVLNYNLFVLYDIKYVLSRTENVIKKLMAINAVSQLGETQDYSSMQGKFLTNFSKLKFYSNYPLTITFLPHINSFVYCRMATDTTIRDISTTTYKGVFEYNVNGDGWFEIATTADMETLLMSENNSVIYDESGNRIYVADASTSNEVRLIQIQNCCVPINPYYMRWINDKGGFDYFMFAYNQENKKKTENTSVYSPYYEDVQTAEALTKVITKEASTKITIGAQNLDDEEYKAVSKIIFSPKVQHYDETLGKWIDVYIDNTELSSTTKESLHSIELTIENGTYLLQY